VALDGTKATKGRQVVFHVFQANTRTKKEKKYANHALRIPFLGRKHETQHVMFVHLVAHPSAGVSSVLLALQVNMWRQLLIYVCNVQQVTCQKNKTVKHVLGVAKVKRQLKKEVLHVQNVT
jgi:hypothetical protein